MGDDRDKASEIFHDDTKETTKISPYDHQKGTGDGVAI
jgi:hypothetical protein